MNLDQLTIEERAALNNLVKSPGWYVLLQHHIIPHYQSASHTLDQLSGASQSQADVCRGIKRTYKQLLEELYKVADLPNPFEQHALGLMTALQSYTTPPAPSPAQDSPAQTEKKERPSRVSFPV